MELNIYNSIILVGVIQGLFFTLIVFFSKKYASNTNKYLALTVLALTLSNLQYLLIDIDSNNTFSFLQRFRIPTEFLILPMFYAYVLKYLFDVDISKKLNVLLILPFLTSLSIHILIALFSFNENFLVAHAIIDEFFCLIISLGFIFYTILQIKRFGRINGIAFKNTQWLIRLLWIGVVLCLIWIGEIFYFKIFEGLGINVFYPLWISISFLIYWISYEGLFQSNIAVQRKKIRKASDHTNIRELQIKNKNTVFSKFEILIREENLFLHPELKQSDVAVKLSVTSNHLSKVLNENCPFNFNDYINELRVQKAKNLLLNKEFSYYTNTAIGLESGFNSKSTFFKAFKKHTGMTPSQYKEDVRKRLSPEN